MPRVWLIVIAVLAIACGPKGKVHAPGEIYIAPIRFEGNTAKGIPSAELESGMALHRAQDEPRDIDPYQAQLDEDRIRGAYLRLGFFTVKVSHRTERVPPPAGDGRAVIFKIDEGARAKLVKVTYFGLPDDLPEAKARATLALADDAPFDYAPYDDSKDLLLRLLQDSGYAHARIDTTVVADRVNAQATVEVLIESGPSCSFADITIEGIPPGALADAVRDRVAFHAGDRYSVSAIEKTQRALYGVGRFSTVRVQPDITKDDSPTVNVKILVSEANRHEARAGFGIGLDPLDYSLRFRLQYTQAGVFDPLTTFSSEFRPAITLLRDTSGADQEFAPLIKLIGRLTRTDLFLPNVRGELEGGLDFLTVEAYRQIGTRARAGLSSPLGWDKLQGRVGWTFGLYDFSNFSPALDATAKAELGLDKTERLGAYTAGISLDLRDNPIEPHKGLFIAATGAVGTRFALGDQFYLQFSPEIRGYYPIGPFTVAGRAHLATISGSVPVTERLYGGGASSDRGFSERRLSPEARAIQPDMTTATVVIGGAGLIEAGAELRFPLFEYGLDFGGAVFLDGGDVTKTPSELDAGNLHWAAGFGIRIFTPIGPARVDFGYRLNRFGPAEPEFGTRFQYFFGFGEAF